MHYTLYWNVRQNLGDNKISFESSHQNFYTVYDANKLYSALSKVSNPDHIEYYNFRLFKLENVSYELDMDYDEI